MNKNRKINNFNYNVQIRLQRQLCKEDDMEIGRDQLKVVDPLDWTYLKLNRDNANKINISLLKI